MPKLELAVGRWIGPQNPCFIIAEIGQNHQGSVEEAKKLIDAAASAGVDCVKFQKTSLRDKFTKSTLQKPYECQHSWGATYGEHKTHLELTKDEFRVLKLYAEDRNVVFTASAKDIPSLHFLVELGVPFIKLGSSDPDDYLLLKEAAASGLPLVISTGMQEIEAITQVYRTVKEYHNKFVFLHCVSSYPTKPEDVNLKVIETYKKKFPDINVGYSGHEMGSAISIAAVALGATVIERHITLDKSQKGNDHGCSLLPAEFESMVKDIRIVEKAMGDGIKRFMSSERICYEKLGKSLVAATNLSEGTILTEAYMKIKVSHPHGIAAANFKNVIGAKLIRSKNYDEPIFSEDVTYN